MMRRMYRHVGSVDLRLSLAVLGNFVVENALTDLDLNVLVGQGGDVRLGVRANAKDVGEVELQLGAGIGAG